MSDTTYALEKGTHVRNRYVIKRVIGRGGFGFTYEAHDEITGKSCAIKEYYPRDAAMRLPDGKTLYQMTDDLEETFNHGKQRFMEEAQVLWKLQGVKSVVCVYDYFEEHNTCYFVMEYIDGVDLKRIIKAKGRLGMQNVREIFFKIGTGLIQVHSMGVFHRDIKPDNIMVTAAGEAKLIDFGNAKNIKPDDDEGYSIMLTPKFAPPEQYQRKGAQGTWTDVYSFASTMFYAMTGSMVPEPMERYTSGERINMEDMGFSHEVSEAMNKALRLDYKERTQTIYELLMELEWFKDGGDTEYHPMDAGIEGKAGAGVNPENKPEEKNGGQTGTHGRLGLEPPDVPAGPGRAAHPYVVIVSGDNAGEVIELPVDRGIVVGRTMNYAQIIFTVDEFISKRHCEIYYDSIEDSLYMTDFSTNGTWVNDFRLNRNQVYLIQNGSMVVLANRKCSFKVGVTYQ